MRSIARNRSIVGFIDSCEGDILTGWAQIPYIPMLPAMIDVLIDGAPVGSCKANVFRPDLRDKGIRDGFAGFQFRIPSKFRDGRTHQIAVTERLSKRQLAGIAQFKLERAPDAETRGQVFLSSVNLATNVDSASFVDAVKDRRKLAVYCAFTPGNDLYAFHHRAIESLRSGGFAILLGQSYTADTDEKPTAVEPPKSNADGFVVKDNLGYDFGTWLSCLLAVREHLPHLDEILLINDSVFGPLTDFTKFSERVASVEGDVIGVCDSYEHNFHLQSFFLLFRRRVLESEFFDGFIDDYPYNNDKERVIREGELALTPALRVAGFRCSAVFPYEHLARAWLERLPNYISELEALPENSSFGNGAVKSAELEYLVNLARHLRRGDPVNPTHYFWDIMLEDGCPFVKRELLLKNPTAHPFLYKARELLASTGYPMDLIRDAARRYGTAKIFF